MNYKPPFPWFGGKSRVSDLVWSRLGNVPNYVEPFFGSGAVLLNRPTQPGTETINDKDCMVANFWRALQSDPDSVAHYADWPVNEADQHARHRWLCMQEEFRKRMKVDPKFYNAKIAGWWVWGQCMWIGSGWCAPQLSQLEDAETGNDHSQLPHLGDAGMGIHRKLPHLGDAGMGIHRKRPHLGNAGMGIHRPTTDSLAAYMQQLSDRLRGVRVCCGDWSRIMGKSPTFKLGITGIFLDPPYSDAARNPNLYAADDLNIAREVRSWAIEAGNNRELRIALCGYEGEHDMPDAWECIEWKAKGGYGSQGDGNGRENAERERIWFSPHCLGGQQLILNLDEQSLRKPPQNDPLIMLEEEEIIA
jgi:site-specific DNA-adenine methylase